MVEGLPLLLGPLTSSETTAATDSSESPVLVMFDSKGKGIHARLMPAKGVDFEGLEHTLKLWAGDLDRLGYKRVTFRSDTEVSILAFLRERAPSVGNKLEAP